MADPANDNRPPQGIKALARDVLRVAAAEKWTPGYRHFFSDADYKRFLYAPRPGELPDEAGR